MGGGKRAVLKRGENREALLQDKEDPEDHFGHEEADGLVAIPGVDTIPEGQML